MLEFEEYKVKLNNLKPELEELYTSLGLEQAKREVEELEIKSSQPGFWDNPEESQKIVSRMGSLKGKVEAYNKMTELCDDLLTICEMAIEENDESMLEELENGYKELEDGIAEQKLRTLLTGEYDSHNALVSFHAGAGGTEAQDWCAMLYRMYTRWAERHGFTYKIMDYQDGDTAGIKSADILIEGENAYGFLKGENGVHRLVRISPFDASGRRQTSFSAVEVVPDIPDTSTDFETRKTVCACCVPSWLRSRSASILRKSRTSRAFSRRLNGAARSAPTFSCRIRSPRIRVPALKMPISTL